MDSLVIKAATEDEAAQKALKQFGDKKTIKLRDLKIKEMSSMFSGFKKEKKYEVSYEPKKDINFTLIKEGLDLNKKFAYDFKEIVKFDLRSYQPSEEAELVIKKSGDKMKAYLDYIPSEGYGKDLTFKEIKEQLKEAGIVYGIKDYSINLIIDTDEPLEDVLVAEGTKPKPGEDAKLEFHFDTSGKNVGTVKENDRIDFHDLGIINNVEEGKKLVTKIEAKPGEEGKNIEGKTLKPKSPKNVKLPKGENTKITEDNTLIATEVGHVSYNQDKVNVITIYKVKGDVDFNTGNINFKGSVFIEGNVTEGFEVKAKGDIHVRGNVEACELISGGDVIINKNFIAKNKGKIECEGDLKAQSIQNGQVNCKGDIYIKDAIMHSNINSAGSVELTGHKGLIVGGEVRATKTIKANIIGSSLATKTIVSAGIDPETRRKRDAAESILSECKSSYLKTVKAINILGKIKKQQGGLPKQKADMYSRLIETKSDLKEKIEKNDEIVKDLTEKINSAVKGKIMVKRKLYPGVKIQIGKYKTEIDETHTRTVFKVDGGELRSFAL